MGAPFEFIFNTPSHHRVHHGRNPFCIDKVSFSSSWQDFFLTFSRLYRWKTLFKNYAGVLIIWDRMFGTFEAEKEDEEIVYGLVDQPQYFNPFKHQVRLFKISFKNVKTYDRSFIIRSSKIITYSRLYNYILSLKTYKNWI